MEEKELVKRAKQGDVNVFCFLYDQYKSKLFNYAFYRLVNSVKSKRNGIVNTFGKFSGFLFSVFRKEHLIVFYRQKS